MMSTRTTGEIEGLESIFKAYDTQQNDLDTHFNVLTAHLITFWNPSTRRLEKGYFDRVKARKDLRSNAFPLVNLILLPWKDGARDLHATPIEVWIGHARLSTSTQGTDSTPTLVQLQNRFNYVSAK